MELNGFCAAIIFIKFEGHCKNNKYYAWRNAAGRRRLRWVEAEMTTGLMKKLVSNNFLSTRVGFTLPFCGTNYIRDQDISVPQPVRTIIKGFPTFLATGSEDYFYLYLISVQVKTGLTTTFSSSSGS